MRRTGSRLEQAAFISSLSSSFASRQAARCAAEQRRLAARTRPTPRRAAKHAAPYRTRPRGAGRSTARPRASATVSAAATAMMFRVNCTARRVEIGCSACASFCATICTYSAAADLEIADRPPGSPAGRRLARPAAVAPRPAPARDRREQPAGPARPRSPRDGTETMKPKRSASAMSRGSAPAYCGVADAASRRRRVHRAPSDGAAVRASCPGRSARGRSGTACSAVPAGSGRSRRTAPTPRPRSSRVSADRPAPVLRHGEADQVVEVQEGRVVVAMREPERLGQARQDQRLRRAVRTDQQQRRFGRQCRQDHRLEVIPAGDAEGAEQARRPSVCCSHAVIPFRRNARRVAAGRRVSFAHGSVPRVSRSRPAGPPCGG